MEASGPPVGEIFERDFTLICPKRMSGAAILPRSSNGATGGYFCSPLRWIAARTSQRGRFGLVVVTGAHRCQVLPSLWSVCDCTGCIYGCCLPVIGFARCSSFWTRDGDCERRRNGLIGAFLR